MSARRIKKIILKPLLKPSANDENKSIIEFVNKVKDQIDILYIDPLVDDFNQYFDKLNLKIMSSSEKADYIILNDISDGRDNYNFDHTYINNSNITSNTNRSLKSDDAKHNTSLLGKKIGWYKKVHSNKDIEDIKNISDKGANFVIIDVEDWKIIPLENIIAILQKTNTEIFAFAKSVEEVKTLFSVLELGVDGIILETENEEKLKKIKELIQNISFDISTAKIVQVKDVGIGERVCIDTVSMLSEGEGMLIGNKSNFLFLVHNESIGSSFTSPRPFRVNAGAVHCYTITPDGTTKYLSELESGSQVTIVNIKGLSRTVSVGRSKIETRPLRLFKAVCKNETGTIIVQNAETIRFLNKEGQILPVTHIKTGDEVLVYCKKPSGRHFGMEVSEEYIIEK